MTTTATGSGAERPPSRLRLQITVPDSAKMSAAAAATVKATPATKNTATMLATATSHQKERALPTSTALPPHVSPTPHRNLKETTTSTSTTPSVAWPAESADALPALDPQLISSLERQELDFKINDECTALKFCPSGRLLLGGFTDGTVRLFDLTGCHQSKPKSGSNSHHHGGSASTAATSFDSSSTTTFDTSATTTATVADRSLSVTTTTNGKLVCSKEFTEFGAVACQIHAKGVHTSLRMDLDVSPDGLWCFAGVLRGSMELVAVHLGHLATKTSRARANSNGTNSSTNLLDHVTVHRHNDAKLRGFGACTRLQNSNKYLLFTGKAIKNIHVWSFEPPSAAGAEPVWQQLYDTQTNGNTISLLQFRYSPVTGNLQGVSKSQQQKLRVWDLSHEQANPVERPTRPPFQDVASTESTLGVAGGFCLNGGSGLYNQMSIVALDVDNLQSVYNHTELALPGLSAASSLAVSGSRRRQQRGDLKSIVSVAGMALDAGQVLLELSDGSILQYTTHQQTQSTNATGSGLPKLTVWKEAGHYPESVNRNLCVGRIGSVGLAVSAIATYDSITGRGGIAVRALDPLENLSKPRAGFWGFAGEPTMPDPSPVVDRYYEPEIQALTKTIHPVTTVKKAARASHQAPGAVSVKKVSVVSTAKKTSVLSARKSIVTPKQSQGSHVPSGKKSSLPLVRRLATTTPLAPPRAPLDTTFVQKASSGSKSIASNAGEQESRPVSAKYLKTASGSRKLAKAAHPVDALKRKSSSVKAAVPRKDVAVATKALAPKPEFPKKRSPPIPRKRAASGKEKPVEPLIDVADALCSLATSPAAHSRHAEPARNTVPSKSSRPPKSTAFKSPVRMHARRDSDVTQKRIVGECVKQQATLSAWLDSIPTSTVAARVNLSAAVTHNMEESHVFARGKMAAQHCAAHELIRKKVLRATLCILQSLKRSPSVGSLDEAKSELENTVQVYQDIVVRVVPTVQWCKERMLT